MVQNLKDHKNINRNYTNNISIFYTEKIEISKIVDDTNQNSTDNQCKSIMDFLMKKNKLV